MTSVFGNIQGDIEYWKEGVLKSNQLEGNEALNGTHLCYGCQTAKQAGSAKLTINISKKSGNIVIK